MIKKILTITLIVSGAVYSQALDIKNNAEAKQRLFKFEQGIEADFRQKNMNWVATSHDPKDRSVEKLFIDIDGDGALEACSCRPWDYTNGGRYYSVFLHQTKFISELAQNPEFQGWVYNRDDEDNSLDFGFLSGQLYEINKEGKSRYFIFDDKYYLRISKIRNIEKYIDDSLQSYEGPPKGLDGSLGWIPPTRAELLKEFGEADVLLWEKAGKTEPMSNVKDSVTTEYLLNNWEKHTITELFMNEEKTQVKGKLVKTLSEFQALLKDGKWKLADVTVERYQWAYAKKINIIDQYYDEDKQQPVMLDVAVEGELVKTLEFGPYIKTKIFTKEGPVLLESYKKSNKPLK